MELTIWSGNLRSQVLEACNSKGCPPRHFELPDIKVDAFLNDIQGGLQKALSPDPLLKGQMMEARASVMRDLAQLMAYWVGMAETEITKVITTTIATVGTAAGALVLGIFGIVSGVASIGGEIYSLSKDAEKVEGELFKSVMATLKKRPGGNWAKIKVSPESIARKLGPTDLVVETPLKCKDMNELYDHKLQGLDTKSHDLAVKLNTALEKSDELHKVIDQEARKRLSAMAAASPAAGAGGRRGAMSADIPVNSQAEQQSKSTGEAGGVDQ